MRHKAIGNVPTDPISDLEASTYVSSRGGYDYPKAHVVYANAAPYDIQLTPTRRARFVVPAVGVVTDMWLDQYHHSLLWSHSQEDRLLGLVSVVYWGYFTFGDAYARNKVSWLLAGNRAMPATTPAKAFAHTAAAQNHLNQRNAGEALTALRGLSQLNQTPFASKVIAFMSPSIAGVYDNRIADGISLEPWASHIDHGVGQTNSPQIRNGYQAWCVYLSQVASQLNLGIALGKQWRWSCGGDDNQLWRALDVERALFAIYGMPAADGDAA